MNTSAIKVETPLSELAVVPFVEHRTIQEYFDLQKFPASVPVICVRNDVPVLREHWHEVVLWEDKVSFIAIPGRGFISVIAQIAVTIGVTIATGGNIVAGVAAGAAVGALLNLVIQPKFGGANENAASPTYSIGAQGNSARLLNPIPRGYGRHIIYPDFASQPYTTYEGNEQILFELFCLGLGKYRVEQIRIEDTVLWANDTGYTDSFEDVTIEIIEPGQPLTLFPAAVQSSAEVSGADMLFGATLGPFTANAANTLVNRLSFDRVFQNGLYTIDKNGKLKPQTVRVTDRAQLIDDTGAPLGPWIVLGSPSYTRATATAQRFTDSYDVPLGRYRTDTVRNTADSTDDTKVQDKVQWSGLRAFQPSENVYPDVTLLAVRIKATNQLSQQSSRLFNVIQTGKVPVWNGATWSEEVPTRSIAWAAADMLRNPKYGEGRPDSLIDLQKLLQLDAIWSARNDTFNGVFDTKRTFFEALNLLLTVGRAKPLLLAGVMTFVRDEPRSIAKGVFTPGNIRAGSFQTNHILYDSNTADDVIVEYQDERTWKPNEVQCALPESTSENPARINIFGITNYAQAWREGIYQAAANNYRRINGSLTSEMEGKLLVLGDAAIVSHDMAKWGTAGEVEDYNAATRTVFLTEPAEWTNGPFLMSFADKRNRQWGPVVVTRGTQDDEAVFDIVSLNAIEAAMGSFESILVIDPNRISTRYTHGSTVRYAKRFIVTGVRPQGFDSAAVGLLNDDPRVYVADTGVPPEEPDVGGIGADPSAPRVDGVRVTLDPSSGSSPVLLAASWNPARGATSYVVQFSYDGSSFDTVYEGVGTSCSFIAQANDIIVRVAAIGSFRGPWAYGEYDFDPENKVPEEVRDLSVTVAMDQSVVTADWFPGKYASAYTVEFIVEG